MFDMGCYGNGAHFLFRCAVENRNLEVARWLLAHGARPVETPADAAFLRSPPAFTLAEFAELTGQAEMAALLLEHGADTSRRVRQGAERLAELCVRGDRSGAQAEAREHPELLRSMKPWEVAAHLNHPRAMALLLELGGRVDTSDAHGATPLHFASFAGSLKAVEFLLAHGADANAVERRYHGTPFGWACYRERWEVARRLLPITEDVWALAFRGYVERLGEVLRERPELARQVRPAGVTYSGYTPLWWLAGDDAAALAATELLLAAGADARHRNPNGRVAADWARTLGLTAVVERLERAAGEGGG